MNRGGGFSRFIRRKANWLGLGIIGLFVLAAVAAPLLAPPDDPQRFSPFRRVEGIDGGLPAPPGAYAYLGTIATSVRSSQLDVFYTLVWGTRSALRFGLLVTLITACIGVVIGALSAYIGGWAGLVAMRVTDAFLAFPLIAGVVILQQVVAIAAGESLAVSAGLGSRLTEPGALQQLLLHMDPVMLAFILFLWMPYARLTHTMVLQIKGKEYLEAAQALGAGSGRMLLRHLIPNAISPAIVLAARDIGLVVILQASLTFIGIVNSSEWGTLLAAGRRWIIGTGGNPFTYWWAFIPATAALVLFGVGWNVLGDGLNDWLNPRND